MRSNNSIGIWLSVILFLGEHFNNVVDARVPLPFLRGGSSVTATTTKKMTANVAIKKQKVVRPRKSGGGISMFNPKILSQIAINVAHGLGEMSDKIHIDASLLGENIGREWNKIASSTKQFVDNIIPIPLLQPGHPRRKTLKSTKLDEVCHTFSTVIRGNDLDTAQLLKACRAHVDLMKTGGPSLRLVAKDLEANVQKAERAFKKSPQESKDLTSLLESEKRQGIHNGDELEEMSAAMGLLWIRRSLAFQLDLYASLIHGQVHPREAAYRAYDKHLSPFHGWALRKIFPASLSQMPHREVFLAKFGGIDVMELNDEYVSVIARKLTSLIRTWDPLLSSWKELFERLGLEDVRKV